MKRWGIASLLLLGLAACGGDQEVRHDGTTTPKPTEVKGSLTGRVLDPFRQPIPNASVKIDVGSEVRSFPVGDGGYFAVRNLPAGGSLDVRIVAEGYTMARFQADIPAEAGDYPQKGISVDVGDIHLLPRTETLEFPVINEAGQRLRVENAMCGFGPAWIWDEMPVDGIFLAAEVDEGVIRCPGLPPTSLLRSYSGVVVISFPAQDLDGDGFAEYAGANMHFEGSRLATEGMPTIFMENIALDIVVVASNTPDLLSAGTMPALPSDDPVEIVFSVPVVALDVQVAELAGEESVEATAEVDGATLRIRPKDGWKKGQGYRYNVAVHPVGFPSHVLVKGTTFYVESSGTITASATFDDWNDDQQAAIGEPIDLHFSEYIHVPLAPEPVDIQFNADLDMSGEIGDADYELGSPVRLSLVISDEISREATFFTLVDLPEDTEMHIFLGSFVCLDMSEKPVGDLVATLKAKE